MSKRSNRFKVCLFRQYLTRILVLEDQPNNVIYFLYCLVDGMIIDMFFRKIFLMKYFHPLISRRGFLGWLWLHFLFLCYNLLLLLMYLCLLLLLFLLLLRIFGRGNFLCFGANWILW